MRPHRGRGRSLPLPNESGDKRWTSPVGQTGRKIADDNRYSQLDRSFWAHG
jgi:hypothetical protein